MSDNPKKKKQDRKLVSKQPYEIEYLKKKLGVPKEKILKAKQKVGPSRSKITKEIKGK